jgi:hypothetical protein
MHVILMPPQNTILHLLGMHEPQKEPQALQSSPLQHNAMRTNAGHCSPTLNSFRPSHLLVECACEGTLGFCVDLFQWVFSPSSLALELGDVQDVVILLTIDAVILAASAPPPNR